MVSDMILVTLYWILSRIIYDQLDWQHRDDLSEENHITKYTHMSLKKL